MKRIDKLSGIVHDEKDSVNPDKSNDINITDIRAQLLQIQLYMDKMYIRMNRIDDTLNVIANNMKLINQTENYASEKLRQAENLSKVINQNTNDIRNMLGEFKGILCIVRPEVKKTGWYGEEFGAKGESISKPIEIGRCNVEIDGVDRLGVTRKKLT
jgi:hypothetical protein